MSIKRKQNESLIGFIYFMDKNNLVLLMTYHLVSYVDNVCFTEIIIVTEI